MGFLRYGWQRFINAAQSNERQLSGGRKRSHWGCGVMGIGDITDDFGFAGTAFTQ
jgi:coproporphyrinogen III oxidase-like Fe-S oxidoreductase